MLVEHLHNSKENSKISILDSEPGSKRLRSIIQKKIARSSSWWSGYLTQYTRHNSKENSKPLNATNNAINSNNPIIQKKIARSFAKTTETMRTPGKTIIQKKIASLRGPWYTPSSRNCRTHNSKENSKLKLDERLETGRVMSIIQKKIASWARRFRLSIDLSQLLP